MAKSNASPVSFEQFIQADREKKKRETLANQILGKGRRDSAPAGGNVGPRRGVSSRPTLASRIGGVNKRTQLGQRNPRNPGKPALPRTASTSLIERGNRIQSHIEENGSTGQYTLHDHTSGLSSGLKIRGAAGPATIIASNFAPGTTASDISSVVEPMGGEIVSCKLVSASPTVICEITFQERSGAENVVKMLNNRRADNRLLYVYFKEPSTEMPARGSRLANREVIDVETDSRRAPPDYQDGSFGFRENRREKGLVSDSMIRRGRNYRR